MSSSASPVAAWFDDPEHSDVLINVYAGTTEAAPRTKKAKTGRGNQPSGPAPASPPARSFHCHAIILAAHSDYFKAQLSSTWLQPSKPASTPMPAAGTTRTVDVFVQAEELDAMQELLMMLYSQALPAAAAAAPGKPRFLHCLHLADRFQAAGCVELLTAALAAIPSCDLGFAAMAYVFQASAGVELTPSFAALRESSVEALARLFGDVPEVITNEGLLQQFCALPHAAVLAWAQYDRLRVHSENCVVFLLTAWVKANQGSTAAQHEQLAHQVRVFHLGPAYQHHILPHLDWFKDCSGMQQLPAVLSCIRAGVTRKLGQKRRDTRYSGSLDCPPAWLALPRCRSNSPRTGRWDISSSQLQAMHDGAQVELLPPVYVNGFLMEIIVQQVAPSPESEETEAEETELDETEAAATESEEAESEEAESEEAESEEAESEEAESEEAESEQTGSQTLSVCCCIHSDLMEDWGVHVPACTRLLLGPVDVTLGNAGSQMRRKEDIGSCVLQCDDLWGMDDFLNSSAPSVLELLAPCVHGGQLHVEATFIEVDMVL